jgi:uncharacterized membrane protein
MRLLISVRYVLLGSASRRIGFDARWSTLDMNCWIICLPEIMALCGAVALAVWLADAHIRSDVLYGTPSLHIVSMFVI